MAPPAIQMLPQVHPLQTMQFVSYAPAPAASYQPPPVAVVCSVPSPSHSLLTQQQRCRPQIAVVPSGSAAPGAAKPNAPCGSFAPTPMPPLSTPIGSKVVVPAPVVSRARSPLPLKAVHRLPFSPSQRPVQQAPQQKRKPIPVEVTIETISSEHFLPLGPRDVRPWLDAATNFELNSDFDVSAALQRTTGRRRLDLAAIMGIMKEESNGKMTIQALADKLVLHKMVEHMGIPQMPALMEIDRVTKENVQGQIERLVFTHLCSSEAHEVVLKPTHLSNGKGVVIVSPMRLDGEDYPQKVKEVDATIKYLVSHVEQHLAEQASAHESVALRTLQPGFVAQPKYQSVVGFKTPLELRVVVLWGKVRLALWWWGRGPFPDGFPQRNAWFVRRPAQQGELADHDEWELIHEHVGANRGFDRAVELFHRHISAIAITSEALAVAVGAPFLRADFFVGSAKWGVRLNEVAYGCGVDYRNRVPDDWGGRIVDDAPAIAHILQEGMARCKKRHPPEHFLSKLGVKGASYEDLAVAPASGECRLMPDCPLGGGSDDTACQDCAVPEDLCATRPGSIRPTPSVSSGAASASYAPVARCWVSGGSGALRPKAVASATVISRRVRPESRSRSFHTSLTAEVAVQQPLTPRAISFNSALRRCARSPSRPIERRVVF